MLVEESPRIAPAVHRDSVALSYQLVFLCDKPFKSNRTTRVEFAGGNSKLGPGHSGNRPQISSKSSK
jgi:hypothetical protein